MSLQFNPFTGTFDVTTKGDTGAVAAAGDGSAAAPGITFASDTNTGIYRPGADQLALSTNGTGRLFIDASGRVGVGTANPTQPLEVTGGFIKNDTGTLLPTARYAGASGGAYISTNGTDNPIQFVAGTANTERLRITSTGQLSHIGAGSSGSPAVSFSGSAPSNSLVVDSSGNIGVSAAPTYRFDVSNGGASAAAVRILGNDQSNVRLRLQNSGSGGRAYEIVGGSNAANNSHFTIYDATAAATRLAISDTGLVGVGTASPSQLLHVRGNALVTGSGGWTTNEEANIYLGDIYGSLSYDFNTTNLKTKSFGSISFLTGGTSPTERLRITSTGLVGIGTSSPLCLIDGRGGADGNVMLLRGGSTRQLTFGTTSTNPFINADNGAGLEFQVNGSARAVLDTSGRLGIGTTSPTQRLQVTDGTLSNFYIAPGYNGGTGTTIGVGGGEYLAFSAAPFSTERARITSSGQLLVGTSTAPSYFTGSPGFSVNGTGNDSFIAAARYNSANAFGSDIAFLRSRSGTVGTQTIVQSGDALGALSYLGSDGTSFIPGARIIGEVDGTPGANTMPGRLVFSTTSSTPGASPTPRLTITSTGQVRLAGAGITFNGDTATANELDDYEEGTFTPTVVGTTTAGTATYAAQIGRYTKIGNLVNFTVYLSWTGGTGSGDLKVNGLPFTINSESNRLFACSVAWVEGLSLTAGHVPQAALYNNETRINIQSYPTGGTSFANVAYDAGAAISITGSYTV